MTENKIIFNLFRFVSTDSDQECGMVTGKRLIFC